MIRALLYGLGPIGVMVARQLATRDGFRIVGAIDVDPTKVGRDVGEIAGLPRPLRVKVAPDARAAIKQSKPDVVVLCTSSSARAVMPQIEAVLKARVPIVTTTEELSYPVRRNAALARKIDAMAKKAKVAVLSTGVNPGFVMDALPITLTVACERIESVTVHRVQDARTRRLPFQQKIGAGLSRDQFQREVERGSIRHVGLAESISMVADALGWRLDRITDEVKPKVADTTVSSEFFAVDAGYRQRDHSGRRRIPAWHAGDHHAHGGLSRSAGVVRRSAHCRVAEFETPHSRRRARRYRDGVDRGELHSQGAVGPPRSADHERPADTVLL